MNRIANQAAAVDAPVARLFAFGYHWRRATAQRRSPDAEGQGVIESSDNELAKTAV